MEALKKSCNTDSKRQETSKKMEAKLFLTCPWDSDYDKKTENQNKKQTTEHSQKKIHEIQTKGLPYRRVRGQPENRQPGLLHLNAR